MRRTTAQYLKHRAASVAPLTLSSERNILNGWATFVGSRQLRQIGQALIEEWLTSIRHLAPTTIRTRFTIVRSFLEWCTQQRILHRNPAAPIRTPKVPRGAHRALNATEAGALLAACRDTRDTLVVLLGLQLGARRGEVAALHLEHIDWARMVVTLTGKGGHSRTLPIPEELAHALHAYLADRPAARGPLIRNDRNPHDPVKPVWVGRLASRIATDAGVKRMPWDGVGMHALRHTAGTDVARVTNGNAVAVRDFLGHANIATSQVYIDQDPARLRSAVEGRRYGRAEVKRIA